MLKLFYFKAADGVPNFGDDLNEWIWHRLLGRHLSDDGETLLTGIGTILNDRVPAARRTAVFGSGVGFGGGLPRVDASWTFYCVRGPLSAQALGLPSSTAATDPALFVANLAPPAEHAPRYAFSYMPHYRNANDKWAAVCGALGFGYIDPRHDRERVLAGMRETRTLITEAMHGAIVADALGIPWIAVRSGGKGTMEFKWQDWCGSLEMEHRAHALPALFAESTSRARSLVKSTVAAAQLLRLSRTATPQLSAEGTRARRLEQLYEQLHRLERDLERGAFATPASRVTETAVAQSA